MANDKPDHERFAGALDEDDGAYFLLEEPLLFLLAGGRE